MFAVFKMTFHYIYSFFIHSLFGRIKLVLFSTKWKMCLEQQTIIYITDMNCHAFCIKNFVYVYWLLLFQWPFLGLWYKKVLLYEIHLMDDSFGLRKRILRVYDFRWSFNQSFKVNGPTMEPDIIMLIVYDFIWRNNK